MLHSSKLVHVDEKNLTLFTQNLVQNTMTFFVSSKTDAKRLKNYKHQTMLEKRKYTYFTVWELKDSSQICKKTQNKVFLSVLDPWLISIPKWSTLKMFSPVILLLLTLKLCSLVWNLKKNAGNFTELVSCAAGNYFM